MKVISLGGGPHRIQFWCPGCKCAHGITVRPGAANGWDWNGDTIRPTISPSIRVDYGDRPGGRPICHSFVTDGKICFCTDSTHDLKGQTVSLPPWDQPDQAQ